MIKRSNLYLFTFLGVFSSLILVGAIVSPLLLHMIRSTYLSISTEVHRREAQIIAQIMSNLIKQGQPKFDVINALQYSLAHTDVDSGYLYLIDENTGEFLAHPTRSYIGRHLNEFDVNFVPYHQQASLNLLPYNLQSPLKFSNAVKTKQWNGGGVLITPGGTAEIVNSSLVPLTNFRIFSLENMKRLNEEIDKLQRASIIVFLSLGFLVAFPASFAALKISRRYEKEIEEEQAKSERLLLNILPASIAQRLKAQETNIANHHDDVSVLFIDMVNFTRLSAQLHPQRLVEILSYIFSQFDAISKKYGLEKIKTMGDAYMVVGGIPEFKANHLQCCIEAGLEMLEFMKNKFDAEIKLEVRIGIHVGPVVAGVIGMHKFSYDLWGETVNFASRLETTSPPGYIHCSEMVYQRMKKDYKFLPREKILLKGVGEVSTYLLVGKK